MEYISIPTWILIGAFFAWSSTLAGVLVWLNDKFNSVLTFTEYEGKHKELTERIRILELWASKKSFPVS